MYKYRRRKRRKRREFLGVHGQLPLNLDIEKLRGWKEYMEYMLKYHRHEMAWYLVEAFENNLRWINEILKAYERNKQKRGR